MIVYLLVIHTYCLYSVLHIAFSKYDCKIMHKAYYLFTCGRHSHGHGHTSVLCTKNHAPCTSITYIQWIRKSVFELFLPSFEF